MDLQITTPVEDFWTMGVFLGWFIFAAIIVDIVCGVVSALLGWLYRHIKAAWLKLRRVKTVSRACTAKPYGPDDKCANPHCCRR